MANNYLQFSFTIDEITDDERDWLRKLLDEADEPPTCVLELGSDPDDCDTHEHQYKGLAQFGELDDPGFHVEIEDDGSAWVYAEESGDPNAVGRFLRAFLAAHRPESRLGFQWAEWCSKLRTDEFGGGAISVTADGETFMHTTDWLDRQAAS
jgi:hypothetical protein